MLLTLQQSAKNVFEESTMHKNLIFFCQKSSILRNQLVIKFIQYKNLACARPLNVLSHTCLNLHVNIHLSYWFVCRLKKVGNIYQVLIQSQFLCNKKQITESLKEEIDHLAGITNSKEQLETQAMAKLTHCRGMLSSHK